MLTYADWINLREKSPPYLKDMMTLCAEFYQNAPSYLYQSELPPEVAYTLLIGTLQKIIGEYKSFAKDVIMSTSNIPYLLATTKGDVTDDKTKERLDEYVKLETQIGNFFNHILYIGQGKNIAPEFFSGEGRTNKIKYGISQADAFLDGVIYLGIKETYEKFLGKENFLKTALAPIFYIDGNEEVRFTLRESDWNELINKVPDYLQRVVVLCSRIYKKIKDEFINQEIILPGSVERLKKNLYELLEIYGGLIRRYRKSDIESYNELIKGIDENLNEIETNQRFIKFFESGIYEGLSKSITNNNNKQVFLDEFILTTINRILPRMEKKKEDSDILDISTMPVKKSSEEKQEPKEEPKPKRKSKKEMQPGEEN